MKFFNITKILLFASISMTISTFTMNNGISIIANAQSDECSMNACTLINNGRCTSREKCATLGEKYTWNDSLCTKNDDKCGCCFPKDSTKSPTRKPSYYWKNKKTNISTNQTNHETYKNKETNKGTNQSNNATNKKPSSHNNKKANDFKANKKPNSTTMPYF